MASTKKWGSRIPEKMRKVVAYRIRLALEKEVGKVDNVATVLHGIAAELNVSYGAAWSWYHGLSFPTPWNFYRLCGHLGVTTDWMFGRKGATRMFMARGGSEHRKAA